MKKIIIHQKKGDGDEMSEWKRHSEEIPQKIWF